MLLVTTLEWNEWNLQSFIYWEFVCFILTSFSLGHVVNLEFVLVAAFILFLTHAPWEISMSSGCFRSRSPEEPANMIMKLGLLLYFVRFLKVELCIKPGYSELPSQTRMSGKSENQLSDRLDVKDIKSIRPPSVTTKKSVSVSEKSSHTSCKQKSTTDKSVQRERHRTNFMFLLNLVAWATWDNYSIEFA